MDGVYLYDRKRDWIYSTGGQAKAMPSFHDRGWLRMLEETVSLQHLPVRVNLDEHLRSGTDTYYSDYYTAKQVLTVVSDGNRDGYFVVNLDVQGIALELYRKYIIDSREFYLTDDSGTILFGCGAHTDGLETGTVRGFANPSETGFWWNEAGYLYYARQLSYKNIYCVEKIPYRLIYGSAERLALVILSITLLITISTILLTIINARRLYRPIGNLYRNIGEKNESGMSSGDEIAVITRIMRELNRLQKDNAEEIRVQREQLQSELLRLMLNQMIAQEDFLNETLLDAGEQKYRFLVCRMGRRWPNEETEQMRRDLRDVLNTYLNAKEKGIFTEYRYGVYVALYESSNEDSTDQVLYQVLSHLTDQEVYCSISRGFYLTESLTEIFHQADQENRDRKFFASAGTQEGQKCTAEDIAVTNYEACLIRDILLGNDRNVSEHLAALESDFVRIRDRDRIVEIAQRILITVDKECRARGNADEVNAVSITLQECETLTELMGLLEEEFQNVCNSVKNSDSSENEYYTRACAYIQENYDQNMNVSEVADYLGISYAYLSKIFKAHSEEGEKLLDYLNHIRIEKAKELLVETNLSLLEVAERVGYNNAQSLQRFFKKYEAVTPGDYRKMKGKKA